MNTMNLRKRRFFGLLAASAALLGGLGQAAADVPTTIATEGALHAKGGGPVADGAYTFKFSLYAAQTGGAAIWTESAKLTIAGGGWSHVLGSVKALNIAAFTGAKQLWLGIDVESEAELPRTRLHAAAYAFQAHRATIADSLNCTACVSAAALKFDGDFDLKGKSLVAGKVTADEVVAKTLVGDGSKISGIQHVNGSCSNKGEVVKGINKDGTFVCVKAMDPDALPADGLDEISNGQLSAEFTDSDKITKAVDIPDNNPSGATATITVPDRGIAKKVTVSIEVTNSDFKKLTVTLTDPKGAKYSLFNDGGKPAGGVLKTSYPAPTKTLSGDLTSWHGNNPKGDWKLNVVDALYKDNKIDGQIKNFQIDVLTLSNKKVQAPGTLIVGDHVKGAVQLKATDKSPVTCGPATIGYMYVTATTKKLMVCNGEDFFPLSLAVLGTQKNPAISCKQILDEQIGAKSGLYWIDNDGANQGEAAWQTWCDMDTDGGGWTRFVYHNDPNGLTYYKNADWDLGVTRAAKGGIKEWLVKTYIEPGQSSQAGTKPFNHWIMNLNAGVQGSKFTHFKYSFNGCNKNRYNGTSWVDSTKLLPGDCKAWHGSYGNGRYLWGEHKWCSGNGPGQMWMSHCGSPSYHMLIVNHNYNYGSGKHHQTLVGRKDDSGTHSNYDENGGAYEMFYR